MDAKICWPLHPSSMEKENTYFPHFPPIHKKVFLNDTPLFTHTQVQNQHFKEVISQRRARVSDSTQTSPDSHRGSSKSGGGPESGSEEEARDNKVSAVDG